MTSARTAWIVSPSYFDVPSWRRLREEVLRCVGTSSPGLECRFVLVDDSAGADPAIGDVEFPDVTVVELPFNVGHQRALTYGLRRISSQVKDVDVVVTLDADGDDRPEDVPTLIEAVDESFSVVLARRTQRHERLSFRAGYVVFRFLFRVLTGKSMRTGNFAAFSGNSGRRMLRQPQFDLSYSSALTACGAATVYKDCPRGRRYEGTPKMNRQRLLIHAFRLLMPFQEQIAVRALVTSATVAALGLAGLVAIAVVRVASNAAIPGWATYSSLIVIAISAIALSNFVVMFAVFSQSRGIALSGLETDFE